MRIVLAFFAMMISQFTFAAAIQVSCRGAGASEDKLVYDTFFNTALHNKGGSFALTSDGRGSNERYDIGNRFEHIEFMAPLQRDSRGRPLRIRILSELLPNGRTADVTLDLSRPKSLAELEFTRTDGENVYSLLSCTTTLPEVCATREYCREVCNRACYESCYTETKCVPGKFSYEN